MNAEAPSTTKPFSRAAFNNDKFSTAYVRVRRQEEAMSFRYTNPFQGVVAIIEPGREGELRSKAE